jgi:hypothetical protein
LVSILVEAMDRDGHLHLAVEVRLLAMSAATINRALRKVREPGGGRKRRTPRPPPLSDHLSVPVQQFSF